MAVIGGRAHINGVTFATNTHVVRGKLSQGNITISVRKLPGIKIFNLLDKVPFLRGVSKLAKLNYRVFFVILLLLLIPWDSLLPESTAPVTYDSVIAALIFYGVTFIVLVFLLKRLWQFHGAEHKAFNVYTNGNTLSLNLVNQASRISDRCGTNLAVILFPLLILQSFLVYQIPLLMFVVSVSIGYEIFNWSSSKKQLKPVYMLARFIQKYIVTAEPDEEQMKVAIATLNRAIECEKGLE